MDPLVVDIAKYNTVLLDFMLCGCRLQLFFPVRIPDFYAKSQSLYDDVFVLFSKWPFFFLQSSPIV